MDGVVGHGGGPGAAELAEVGLSVGDPPQVAVDQGDLGLGDLGSAVLDDRLEEARLVPEVVVDGAGGDVGLGCDRVDAGA